MTIINTGTANSVKMMDFRFLSFFFYCDYYKYTHKDITDILLRIDSCHINY